MLIINNKALKVGNKWLNPVASPTPPTYYYVTTSGTNGTVLATPASGITGTEVTLSNTPDTGYEFDSYTITGATLKNTNQFDIGNSDVSVVGNFVASGPSFDEVTIGTQTWATTNLAIDDGQGGVYVKDNVTANGVNLGTQYYYSIQAANRIVNNINGWHIPSKAEWQTLFNTVNDLTKIKSTSGWPSGNNGTNELGMNILPVGEVANDSTLSLTTGYTSFWTSTVGSAAQPSGNYQGYIMIYNNTYNVVDNAYATLEQAQYYNQINYFPAVRLIKDT